MLLGGRKLVFDLSHPALEHLFFSHERDELLLKRDHGRIRRLGPRRTLAGWSLGHWCGGNRSRGLGRGQRRHYFLPWHQISFTNLSRTALSLSARVRRVVSAWAWPSF